MSLAKVLLVVIAVLLGLVVILVKAPNTKRKQAQATKVTPPVATKPSDAYNMKACANYIRSEAPFPSSVSISYPADVGTTVDRKGNLYLTIDFEAKNWRGKVYPYRAYCSRTRANYIRLNESPAQTLPGN